MRQCDLLSVASVISEYPDKVYVQQLAHLMMARHLISHMWPEEM